MTTMSEHWDNEARTDPRYKAGIWGMGVEGRERPHGTVSTIIREVARGLPMEFAGCVTEIGCGPGRLILPFAQEFPLAHFTGIDISPVMRELALINRDDVWELTNVSIAGWPEKRLYIPDESQQIVYMVEIIQHLDDGELQGWINLASRFLKPGGEFVAQFVNNGRDAEPFSYPRNALQMGLMFGEEWRNLSFRPAEELHPEWWWVRAVKA